MTYEIDIVRQNMDIHPVNVVQIIEQLGVRYVETSLDVGQSGCIIYDSNVDSYTIKVNKSDSSGRKRFTAAHELAHYLLHRDELKSKGQLNRLEATHTDSLYGEYAAANLTAPFSKTQEHQANQLAAQIIMPSNFLRENYDRTADNYATLADELGVSTAALKIRLKVLGLRATSS